MELTGNWKRWLVLAALVAAFWLRGGFVMHNFASNGNARAWLYAVAAYLSGAVSATVIDHWVGNIDRVNLRWGYVLLGALLMGFSVMCLHVMQGAAT